MALFNILHLGEWEDFLTKPSKWEFWSELRALKPGLERKAHLQVCAGIRRPMRPFMSFSHVCQRPGCATGPSHAVGVWALPGLESSGKESVKDMVEDF